MAKMNATTQLISDILNGDSLDTIGGALGDVLKNQHEENKKRLTSRLSGIVETGRDQIRRHVQALRDVRKQEQEMKKKLTDETRAFAYFLETSDPFPFLRITGNRMTAHDFARSVGIDYDFSDEPSVPQNWNPAPGTLEVMKKFGM